MGEVYAAYDPKLDRRVALKLLRPDRLGDDPEGSRARLLREAQAMARLSHPNVVAVHDVGEVGDQVFVAMEFVDGSTLRDFVAKRHPWREVVRIFVLAGRGLAAAHAAGLVHRDFKPDNVLLGKDGAVRVTDFGLVRPIGEPVPPPAAAAPVAPEMPFATPVGPLSTPLTLVGSVMGTPGYMAPEQYLGLATDARTDVFSFCVALWEGLYGKPPFRGESFHVVAAAATTGRVPDPPVGTDVPEPIHQLLLRGLAPDPAKRWPSMEALLVDLGRDPAAGRKRFLKLGAFGLAVALLFGGVVLAARRQSRQCRGERDRWTGVWDRTRQKAVREAFLATGTPFAAGRRGPPLRREAPPRARRRRA
jgi:serine/threonine protein kinase